MSFRMVNTATSTVTARPDLGPLNAPCAVARYEEHVQRLDNTSGFIDLFWPGVLLVEQKSAGRDLAAARDQAGTYFDALSERDRPRYQLLSDFQTFELLDRDEGEETRFLLSDLPQHVEKFGFIIGVQRRTFRDQDPVNIDASELIARLHDALKASGYEGHDLELFLVRTVFCLFADDTGIFEPRDIFLQFIEERTAPDGADLGAWLMQLFEVLNTPVSRRQRALDEDLARFPHVNGELFAGRLRPPAFDSAMRSALLDAGQFDWTAISPAIFGALFQSVMEPADRRAQGAHYTTEKNILKVIEPLFLDDLRAEFRRLQARRDGRAVADLRRFRDKALSTWPPAGRVTACPATADTGFPLTSSATRCGSIIASRSASETWRTCWPAGVSTSPMRPSGSGVDGSVLSMRADCGADVAGSETPGISTRCSSRSRVASNTYGVPWMRTVTSSTSSCNRDEIGTPRCDSFASC